MQSGLHSKIKFDISLLSRENLDFGEKLSLVKAAKLRFRVAKVEIPFGNCPIRSLDAAQTAHIRALSGAGNVPAHSDCTIPGLQVY